MASLTDLLAAPPKKKECSYGEWHKKLSTDEAEAVDGALANPAWSIARLLDIFRDFGLNVSKDTLSRHRKGECRECNPL